MSCQEEERRIRRAMELSLDLWAVSRCDNPGFRRAALEQALEFCGKKQVFPLDFSELGSQSLPSGTKGSIHYVLKMALMDIKEMDASKWTIPMDKLGLDFAPYYQGSDLSGTPTLRACKGFGQYVDNEPASLDPFRRFDYRRFTCAADYIAATFNPENVGGHIMEAAVACHLQKGQKCFHCDRLGGLRWNGGMAATSAWADIVCVNCEASYEVKSKHDLQKVIDNLVKYDKIPGGNFLAYSKYKRKNHYLVMTHRSPRNGFHSVFAAMIKTVTPALSNASFDSRKVDQMTIASEIKVDDGYDVWCAMPECSVKYYYKAIERAFDEVFGQGEWQKRVPNQNDWENQSKLFNNALGMSYLAESMRGMRIDNRRPLSTSGRIVSRSNAATSRSRRQSNPLRHKARQYITIGPTYQTSRRTYDASEQDRCLQVEHDYHEATYHPRMDRKLNRW